jgi:ParB/RepB/Spo0J family partition protein
MPTIPISSIRTDPKARQREDVAGEGTGSLENLAKSMQEYGQLEPIGLDSQNNLVYGFRRLTAAIMLGWDTIKYERIENLDATRAQEIELEENIRRHDLSYQEESNAVTRIHEMKMAKDPTWTADKTAEALDMSRRKVFNALELSKAFVAHPEIGKAETQAGAMMRLTAIKQLQQRKTDANVRKQAEDLGLKPKTKVEVVCADALIHLKGMAADSTDLAVSNPPYGVDIESLFIGDRTIYKDDAETIVPLLFEVAKEVFRVLKEDRWFVFFYPTARLEEGKEILSEAGFKFQQIPAVWYKPNKYLSSLSNPYQNFSSQYETFFWARKGAPRFNKLRLGNVFVYDTPDRDDRIHPLQMPPNLWKEIIEIGSVEGEHVLEPFAGSGSCGVACVEAARNYLGIELSPEYAERANMWISETVAGTASSTSANVASEKASSPTIDLAAAIKGLDFHE